ncbi:peptidoglycan-binding protein [Microbacterium protaetiae]|uniref:peptidoglycan-binding protein n=1 Tax=Microbacterium protaetiae TaxID=2509458 RepID=UPI0013EBE543|nr:peptidoglycan-binding protein [Microbacterium protaetiae]
MTSALSVLITLVAVAFVRSPAQVAAETSPPPLTVLTAKVTEGSVAEPLRFSGEVSLGDLVAFTVRPSDASAAIVTKLPAAVGETVREGAAVIEISDRPVIYLKGKIPLLRDLHVGDHGPDVLRLQRALKSWGGAPEPDGVFGAGTAAALRALYQGAGYSAPIDSSALRSELMFGNGDTARVVALGGAVGEAAGAPAVKVATSPPEVTADIAETTSQKLAVGAKVTVSGAAIGGEHSGRIVAISGLMKSDAGTYQVHVRVSTSDPLRFEAVQSPVDIIVTPDDKPKSGLVVPLSAVYSDAVGRPFVRRIVGGAQARVFVTVGETGGGQALIRVANGGLDIGDDVVVGAQ